MCAFCVENRKSGACFGTRIEGVFSQLNKGLVREKDACLSAEKDQYVLLLLFSS